MSTQISKYLNVPGNIKQIFQPFVLDPANELNNTELLANYDINNDGELRTASKTVSTQYFSFRPKDNTNADEKNKNNTNTDGISFTKTSIQEAGNENGFLKILPNSFYQDVYFDNNNDLANKLCYSDQKKSINAIQLLRNLPYISIREYQRDAKINQILDICSMVGTAFNKGAEFAEKTKDLSFGELAKSTWQLFTDLLKIENFEGIISDTLKSLTAEYNFNFNSNKKDFSNFILKFPYLAYYRIISETSLNIYELPYNGNIMWKSSGDGFNNNSSLGMTEGGSGFLEQIKDYFLKNIRINTSPTWNGPGKHNTSIEIEFSLYNDTIDGAVKNYIFITTLLANNKWTQYHLFQTEPCLYDVKIPGINRLFMCEATITITKKGVYRKPLIFGSLFQNSVLQALASHLNIHYGTPDSHAKAEMQTQLKNQNINDIQILDIRIPDVYEIKITFTSLLPDNFNNYMFQFYKNDKIQTVSGNQIYQTGAYSSFEKAINNTINKMTKDIDEISKKSNTKTSKK